MTNDLTKGGEISLNIAKFVTLYFKATVTSDDKLKEEAAQQIAKLAEIIDKALS